MLYEYNNKCKEIQEDKKMKQELRNYLENEIFQSELSINESWMDTTFRWLYGNKYSLIEGTDFDEFKEVCEEIRDSMILSKEEFIEEAQGSFENDDKNLWVKVEGIDCNVPYETEEKYPFENSDKFDNMGMEEALSDETFNELYEIYLKEKRG